MSKRITTEEWVAKAKAVHGDTYDYSKVEYVNTDTKVVIICKLHGEFKQRPDHHLAGSGCSECKKLKIGNALRNTLEKFIKDAVAVHGDKYDYSLVNYKTCGEEVEIICKTCGNHFTQRPSAHTKRGCGCPECKKVKIAQSRTMSHEEWCAVIAKANPNVEILGEIIDSKTRVPCRCRICGHKWKPKPNNLQQGKGCPKCADHGFLSHEHGNIYIMVDDLEVPTMMKIGVSVRVDGRRKDVLKSAKKVGAALSGLHIIKTWEGSTENMQALEKTLHKALSQYKINFPVKFDGCQEFFYYKPEVFELIEEHLKKFSKQ